MSDLELVQVHHQSVHRAPVVDGWKLAGELSGPGGRFDWSYHDEWVRTRVRDRDGTLPDLVVPIRYPGGGAWFFGRRSSDGLDRGIQAPWGDVEVRLDQAGTGWSRRARSLRCQTEEVDIVCRAGGPFRAVFEEEGLGTLAVLSRNRLRVRSDADALRTAAITMLLAIGVEARVALQTPF